MKVINLIIFTLGLAILSGQESKDRNTEIFKSLSDKTYLPINLQMSENGKWISFLKSYDSNKDTLVILKNTKPNSFQFFRTGFNSLIFSKNDYALLNNESETEFLNLNSGKALKFQDVWRSAFLNQKEQFILHYNDDNQNKLELRDFNGNIINSEHHVKNFFLSDFENLYLISESGNGISEIMTFNNKEKTVWYSSSNPIQDLYIDPSEKSLIIYSENNQDKSKLITFYELQTKTAYHLNKLLEFQPLWGNSKTIIEGDCYFIRLFKKTETAGDLVDLWYGSDNRLEKKFEQPIEEIDYLWFPKKQKIQRIGTDELSKNAPLNKDGLFLSFNPFLLEDYTKEKADILLYIFNSTTNQIEPLDTLTPEIHISPDGNFLLSPKNKEWHLFDLKRKKRVTINNPNLKRPVFTSDGKSVYFEGIGGLWEYLLYKNKLQNILDFTEYETSILNYKMNIVLDGYNFFQNSIDPDTPLIIKLFDEEKNTSAIVRFYKQNASYIVYPTDNHIRSVTYDLNYQNFAYWEENFNSPPVLFNLPFNKKKFPIYFTNKNDSQIKNVKQRVISYQDSFGNDLKGILYFPINYEPNKQFPLVTHIYEKQNHLRNRYLNFDYKTGVGFNIRSLIEKDYFVFLPDIQINQNGPGQSALDCIGNAIKALRKESLSVSKMALIGHSFGGYTTNYIATQSDFFATYISGAGKSDLIHSYYSFNYNFLTPDYRRIESSIYNMKFSFSDNKELYYINNPIYYADSVKAPVLLWSGENDENVPKSESIGFYLALKRNNKKVITLFYRNEIHSLQRKESQIDLMLRIWDWLDYFLKNANDIEWIDNEIKKGAL